ncbi:vacuolar protein sorting-associated protein 35 [Gorgonomyces haynaldii]|nr:vacuolar protein sorting-associated protein 35 [Gorgonomyces haynaldii]
MSTYSINTIGSNGSYSSLAPPQEQGKLLEDALGAVKIQSFHMKKCLENDKLMDAFKYCSTLLGELRSSSLAPKHYYELYMAVFDELGHLTSYLYEAHKLGKHHLSDLYELVQYAGTIVPRLYLMITVGTVYMRVSKETFEKGLDPGEIPPIKEIMQDMLEMSRGVQHATRGLFLRYYLSVMTRDYLPDGKIEGPQGSINDSISFILQNFIEMNKLWVRLQYQGLSRDREKREQERKELRLLVGSNLVRLSQLEEMSLEMYSTHILPSILEEIVSCRDVIAQEYLMEVIIQVFQDEFHLRCLDTYLSAVARLQRDVNVKQIVISLIDRFSAYANRVREELQDGSNGIPEDVKLFEVFWTQVNELVKQRPELTVEDIIALLVSLNGLALNCYPERLDYIDMVFGMCKEAIVLNQEHNKDILNEGESIQLLKLMLLSPIHSHAKNLLILLDLPSANESRLGGNYTDVLFLQPFITRREIAHTFVAELIKQCLHNQYRVKTVKGVNFVLGEVGSIMLRDQIDGNLFGTVKSFAATHNTPEVFLDWEDAYEEQTDIAKLVHVFCVESNPLCFTLLSTARDHLIQGGDIRVRFTLPSLVMALLNALDLPTDKGTLDILPVFRMAHDAIGVLAHAREYFSEDDDYAPLFKEESQLNESSTKLVRGLKSPPQMALNLYLAAAESADKAKQEEMCYEFFVQAFLVYEEAISESRAQFRAINLIIATLHSTTVFGYENYETLITKSAIHCARLLRRVDQCRGLVLASHLFWADASVERDEDKPVYQDGKRVLECLQKALKISDSVMDRNISLSLFVEVLERYIWYYETKNEAITGKYINSLLELIQNNLVTMDGPKELPSGGPMAAGTLYRDTSNGLSEKTVQHFKNVLEYISKHKQEENQLLDPSQVVPGMSSGFAKGGGRWGSIELPSMD